MREILASLVKKIRLGGRNPDVNLHPLNISPTGMGSPNRMDENLRELLPGPLRDALSAPPATKGRL